VEEGKTCSRSSVKLKAKARQKKRKGLSNFKHRKEKDSNIRFSLFGKRDWSLIIIKWSSMIRPQCVWLSGVIYLKKNKKNYLKLFLYVFGSF
jgi:hypothetical protein